MRAISVRTPAVQKVQGTRRRGIGAHGGVRARAATQQEPHSFLPELDNAGCGAKQLPFNLVHSGQSLNLVLDVLVFAGKVLSAFGSDKLAVSDKVKTGLLDLHSAYHGAVSKSPVEPNPDKEAAEMIASIAERVLVQYTDPFTFPSHHLRILEPFNYYDFGQRYVGNLIDFRNSYVENVKGFQKIGEQIRRGENVVLLANHQSEADPGVWAWMMRWVDPELATDIIYIAGDRVVLDTFAKPFSMGRNLICVHSKRHMDDDLEIRAEKMKTNARSVREIGSLFKRGGALVWVAPSGGRDRKNAEGVYVPGQFDPTAVQLLKRLMDGAKPAGHVYPMAMASAEVMPPPASVEKNLGEVRVLDYHGVGISLGEELDSDVILDGVEDKDEKVKVFSDAAYAAVEALYQPLAGAVYGNSEPTATMEQPFKL